MSAGNSSSTDDVDVFALAGECNNVISGVSHRKAQEVVKLLAAKYGLVVQPVGQLLNKQSTPAAPGSSAKAKGKGKGKGKVAAIAATVPPELKALKDEHQKMVLGLKAAADQHSKDGWIAVMRKNEDQQKQIKAQLKAQKGN